MAKKGNNKKVLSNFYDQHPTTKQVAERLMSKYKFLNIINYSKFNQTATEQINFGLEQIYKNSKKGEWVAKYDADSRPNLDTFY